MARSKSDQPKRAMRALISLQVLLKNVPKLLHLVWQAASGWLIINLILTLAGALIPVGQLYVTKLVVDRIIFTLNHTQGNSSLEILPLLMLAGLGLGLSLLQEALQQGNSYVSQVLSDRFTLYANGKLLDQATRLDLTHFESAEFYDTLSRAQQSGSFYPLRVVGNLTQLVGQIIGLIGLVSILIRFSPLVVLLLIITSLPTFWVGVNYSSRRFWMMRRQTQSKRLGDYFGEILTDPNFAKEIRLFNLGQYFLNQYQEIRDSFNQESRILALQQALARFGIAIVASLGFYGAYGLVIWQAVQRLITVGDLTMYGGAFQQAQNAIQGILQNIATIYEYNLYVSQYFEFLSLKPQIISQGDRPFPMPIRSGLEIKNLTFKYEGSSHPALENINLTIQPHECIALVGVNGSGKTTLLKLLARFYDLDAGEITIDGIPLAEFDLQELRSQIGVLFQDFAHYALSVENNIGFGDLKEYQNQAKIQQSAIAAGATEVISELDQGYQTILGKIFTGGVELSGGQWQKIGLARAFMTSAQILILDEPTAAVDAIAEHDLFQRFRELTKGRITFLVSHRFSTVQMADRIVVLDQGKIMEVGTHQELMRLKGLYHQMFVLQAASYQSS
ncbi:ABC-type multidrug transport system, ATPase and permease component [Synechococcus sp. PCC 7502]|uniref:ABC transporter ATP-binding protein n=1 Tax=Synechococcus sp. PCC 7502 TaxID=1173263 RepID=UPI00029FDA8B|nr:ABC transporter ATP-binding protein [Synechococcus sp. PCC 7502]AFY74548.1 ABC-type multidrug transport system, ATPase and permease component [Synechococcus sp. PCC 7502]